MPVLYFIGLGLWDARDMSVKAREAISKVDCVLTEFYTAFLGGTSLEELSSFVGKEIRPLTRHEVEEEDLVVKTARAKDVAFLCAGDSLAATTHVDMYLRARKEGIDARVVNGTSIFTAAPSMLGLQNYKFGKTTTLPFLEERFCPTSPLEVIRDNLSLGYHSLVLLDIRVNGDGTRAEHRRCMTSFQGFETLRAMEAKLGAGIVKDDLMVCAVARAGSPDARRVAGMLKDVEKIDLGPPMHSIVIPGKLHYMEEEALAAWVP